MLILRPYQSEDWPRVCAIYDAAKPDEMHGIVERAAVRRLQDDPSMCEEFSRSTIVVAQMPSIVVGFAGFLGSPHGGTLNWLFVHPETCRAGVATALVGHLLKVIVPPVRLNAVASNVAARTCTSASGSR